MNIRIVLLAFALGLSLPAAATFELVSKAHEVSLADLRLPGSTSGTLTFRPCNDCDYETIRVTTNTQYELNKQAVTLEEFRNKLRNVRNRQDVAATVLHHLESDTVKAVRVYL